MTEPKLPLLSDEAIDAVVIALHKQRYRNAPYRFVETGARAQRDLDAEALAAEQERCYLAGHEVAEREAFDQGIKLIDDLAAERAAGEALAAALLQIATRPVGAYARNQEQYLETVLNNCVKEAEAALKTSL